MYCNILASVKLPNRKRSMGSGQPKLFTTVLENAFKRVDCENRGINIDEKKLNNLRCLDDIVLIADNLKDASSKLEELNQTKSVVVSA